MYEIVKKGKGRYVVLKDRISEAKKALGIEAYEDLANRLNRQDIMHLSKGANRQIDKKALMNVNT